MDLKNFTNQKRKFHAKVFFSLLIELVSRVAFLTILIRENEMSGKEIEMEKSRR